MRMWQFPVLHPVFQSGRPKLGRSSCGACVASFMQQVAYLGDILLPAGQIFIDDLDPFQGFNCGGDSSDSLSVKLVGCAEADNFQL